MDKIALTKSITNIVVGAGVMRLVNGLIRNNTETESVADKAIATSTGVVVGYMAAEITSSYTDAKIDEIVAWWKEIQNPQPLN